MNKVTVLNKCIWKKICEIDYDPMNPTFEHLDSDTKNKIDQFSNSMIYPSNKKSPAQNFQQRVTIEKNELDEKAKALSSFIGTSKDFDDIDPAEKERLKEQCEIMRQYSEILGQRIAAFKE